MASHGRVLPWRRFSSNLCRGKVEERREEEEKERVKRGDFFRYAAAAVVIVNKPGKKLELTQGEQGAPLESTLEAQPDNFRVPHAITLPARNV